MLAPLHNRSIANLQSDYFLVYIESIHDFVIPLPDVQKR